MPAQNKSATKPSATATNISQVRVRIVHNLDTARSNGMNLFKSFIRHTPKR